MTKKSSASSRFVKPIRDEDVYAWLRKFGNVYSTRINSVLREVMSRSR